jgi:hypothetical protein
VSRQTEVDDPRLRAIRMSALVVVWIGGLMAGFYALLAAAARYGCMSGDNGMACRTSGSITGLVLLGAVVATVTVVTLLTANRATRPALAIAGVGFAVLAGCLIAAHSLLSTA